MLVIQMRKKGLEKKDIAKQLKMALKDVNEVINNYPWYKERGR